MAKNGAKPAPDQICDKCGHHNPSSADSCKECGSTRFAPTWVKELRHVTRNAYVQLTQPAERDGEQPKDRITLYKWWPGNSATFNIPSATQWVAAKKV